ncbi:MAG: hypothetical protein GC164_15295 [Phycisphaera sp.]|nr:hypothetical protein [Phycisphaera sp.]
MNRRITSIVLAVVMSAVMSHYAQAALLATYTFTSGPTEVPTATNLTFGQLSRTNVTSSTLSGAFNSSAWNTTATPDLTEYVEFTVTPASGYTLLVDKIVYDVRATSTGPATAQVRFSLDSYTQTFSAATAQNSTFQTGKSADFTDTSTGNGTPVAFRVYGLSGRARITDVISCVGRYTGAWNSNGFE